MKKVAVILILILAVGYLEKGDIANQQADSKFYSCKQDLIKNSTSVYQANTFCGELQNEN